MEPGCYERGECNERGECYERVSDASDSLALRARKQRTTHSTIRTTRILTTSTTTSHMPSDEIVVLEVIIIFGIRITVMRDVR